ncbi:hypothetical protein [Caballeronia sp. LZ035]|uniref:hypothetical protein n=1 Tax=Caballeronia sp. LZ035 TaxID=3038568 RepID=UPI002854AEAE|nr:hypothetical protein [Caballeronia sp. LZ035]MDR5763330.1 hypothetical protein [Caballeronia sp. LZ035]
MNGRKEPLAKQMRFRSLAGRAGRCSLSGHITQITTYKLVNSVSDLGKVSQDLKGTYALGKDIDVRTAASTSFSLIAPTDAASFGGQFDGFGHVVSNLNIMCRINRTRRISGCSVSLERAAS